MKTQLEQKIFEQLNQIARQLKEMQRSLDKLDAQHRKQESGLVQGLRKTRVKARRLPE